MANWGAACLSLLRCTCCSSGALKPALQYALMALPSCTSLLQVHSPTKISHQNLTLQQACGCCQTCSHVQEERDQVQHCCDTQDASENALKAKAGQGR